VRRFFDWAHESDQLKLAVLQNAALSASDLQNAVMVLSQTTYDQRFVMGMIPADSETELRIFQMRLTIKI
jgi:hypothetical protein